MKINPFISVLFLLFFPFGKTHAQCDPMPTITGDTLLCPNENGQLATQTFDTYQWHRREWGASEAEPIVGANGQTLAIGQSDVLYYFSVEVTEDTCSATSPEVLLDGLVFLLPFVETTGNYEFNPNTGAFDVCEGDTIYMALGLPYETNITWFLNGQPIPGETSAVLNVTESGSYTVQGAPLVCPNYIQPLGLSLVVNVEDCTTSVLPEPTAAEVETFPNPATDILEVKMEGASPARAYSLVHASGQILRSEKMGAATRFSVEVGDLPAGVYFLKIEMGMGKEVWEVFLKK